MQDDREAALCLRTDGATLWDGRLVPLSTVTATRLRNTAAQLAQWMDRHAGDRGIAPVLTARDGAVLQALLHRRMYHALASALAANSISDAIVNLAAHRLLAWERA